jgi:spore coat polysaccharide biosynthesis predicted glycosyltransferase SpsG
LRSSQLESDNRAGQILGKVAVLILTEGGRNSGLGHITRCVSIYRAFEEVDIQPEIIVNGDETVRDFVKNENCRIFDWLNNQEALVTILKDADIVFVDSYLAGHDLYEKISDIVGTGVYFDDNIRMNYPRGFVLNGALFAERMPYPERNDVEYLLGIQYAPLGREFWNVPEKSIRTIIETVVITFGGADTRNLTPKVLRLLQDACPQLIKKVIVGNSFQNIAEIEKLKDDYTELIYHPNAAKMRNIMFESDVAISSGGQTLYELARVGVPTIGICVADNQTHNLQGWQEVGSLRHVFWYNSKDMGEMLMNSLKELTGVDVRAKMSQTSRTLIDGQGPRRIVSAVGVG